MANIYLSEAASNGKHFAPTQFPKRIDLNLSNVNRFLFGPYGRCFSTAHFSSGGRANRNYLESDCVFIDIDCTPIDSAEKWKQTVQSKLAPLKLHVFAYPSFHNKVHLLIPYSRPVNNSEDCRKVTASTMLRLKGVFPDLDPACSDPARFSYEGAHVENPQDWSFELDGDPVDVDRILASAPSVGEMKRRLNGRPMPSAALKSAPFEISNRGFSSYLKDLSFAAHTEGTRHQTCICAGNYIVGHSSTVEEAEEAFWNFAGGEGALPDSELKKILEDCFGYTTLGKDLHPQPSFTHSASSPSAFSSPQEVSPQMPMKKSRIVAQTVEEVKKQANRELRRAAHKRRESIADATNTRLNSGQVYSVHETRPGCGYAIPLDDNGYKSWINDLIVENAPDPEIEVAVKNIQNKQFGPDILNHDGLYLREANTAFFANGIFRIFPDRGTFRFDGLKEGQFLENAFTWEFRQSFSPSDLDPALDILNFYFPKRPYENTLISVEAYIFLAFLASAVSRHVDDQRCLLLYGKGGNGKSSLREIVLEVLGSDIMKELPSALLLKEGDRFSAANNNIQSASLLFADDRLPTSSKINAVSMKNLISKGPVDYEIKGGGSWTEDKLFKLLIIANQPLAFSDLTDDGLTRKLEAIEARAQLKDRNGKMPAITDRVINSLRTLLCVFLCMPQIPASIPDDYPLREDWIKEGLQAEVFRSILTPRPDAYVEVVDIKALLAQAGDKNLGNKRLSDLEKALRKNGYEVKKQRNGRKRVKGYIIDTSSTYYRIANHSGINIGTQDEGEDANEDEDYGKRFSEYYGKIAPLVSSFDKCFRGIAASGELVRGEGAETEYKLEPVDACVDLKSESECNFTPVDPVEDDSSPSSSHDFSPSTVALPAYTLDVPIEEFGEPAENWVEEDYSQDEYDYYRGVLEPLPVEPTSVAAPPSFPPDQDKKPSDVKLQEIEPIRVGDIKPVKPLEALEGCSDVIGKVHSWMGEVGVEDSGVMASWAGREVAKKLPAGYTMEDVITGAPTGEFEAVFVEAYQSQKREDGSESKVCSYVQGFAEGAKEG